MDRALEGLVLGGFAFCEAVLCDGAVHAAEGEGHWCFCFPGRGLGWVGLGWYQLEVAKTVRDDVTLDSGRSSSRVRSSHWDSRRFLVFQHSRSCLCIHQRPTKPHLESQREEYVSHAASLTTWLALLPGCIQLRCLSATRRQAESKTRLCSQMGGYLRLPSLPGGGARGRSSPTRIKSNDSSCPSSPDHSDLRASSLSV